MGSFLGQLQICQWPRKYSVPIGHKNSNDSLRVCPVGFGGHNKADEDFYGLLTAQRVTGQTLVLSAHSPHEHGSKILNSSAVSSGDAEMSGGAERTEPGATSRGPGLVFTWEEVQRHSHRNDQWLVIDRKVYNVTQWAKIHPGGSRVLKHYAGEDATEAFSAFHPDLKFVQKFLKPLLIGELAAHEPSQDNNKNASIVADFQALQAQVVGDGMFKVQPWFFCFQVGHILLLEAGAWLLVCLWGTGWGPTLLCSILLTIVQAQASWLQHDFGHLSVFKKSYWNRVAQKFMIGHLKGGAASWWNHRHFQHHSKPNIISKDPDINMVKVLVVGSVQPVEYGIKKIKYLPYHHQHKYFFLIGPPLVIPIVFHTQTMYSTVIRRNWVDLAWSLSFYLRYFACFVPLYGLLGSMTLLTFVRFLESHWFVWVTQMNHLPMDIDHEKHQDWLSMQLQATCNVEQSTFNDWFSGHLNFQIEHHLFPTMPRHNYHRVAPLVRALCEKHGIVYKEKPLGTAIVDVFRSLKNSGELWLDAYLHK